MGGRNQGDLKVPERESLATGNDAHTALGQARTPSQLCRRRGANKLRTGQSGHFRRIQRDDQRRDTEIAQRQLHVAVCRRH